MKIKKVVITAAGMGTRVLPFSKSVSKEMLPVIVRTERGIFVKPYIQFIFEKLYDHGIRKFCFIVGKNKSEVMNHFAPDWKLVNSFKEKNKATAEELGSFFDKVESSEIIWIMNPNSKGFGHSVLVSEPFVKNDPFILCASDVWATSSDFLHRAENLFFHDNVSATLILKKVDNWQTYGVAKIENSKVTLVVEKPKEFISDLGIVPIYLFRPEIFKMLKEVEKNLSEKEEFHLTPAIQKFVEQRKVNCIVLKENEEWLDTGMPEMYKKVIDALFREIL